MLKKIRLRIKVYIRKKKIKYNLWKQDRLPIKEKFIELIKRRDEVIKRARGVIPDFYLMRKDPMVFRDYLLWIVEPHIKRNFTPYKVNKDENERIAQKTVYKLLQEVEKENVKEEESLPTT